MHMPSTGSWSQQPALLPELVQLMSTFNRPPSQPPALLISSSHVTIPVPQRQGQRRSPPPPPHRGTVGDRGSSAPAWSTIISAPVTLAGTSAVAWLMCLPSANGLCRQQPHPYSSLPPARSSVGPQPFDQHEWLNVMADFWAATGQYVFLSNKLTSRMQN